MSVILCVFAVLSKAIFGAWNILLVQQNRYKQEEMNEVTLESAAVVLCHTNTVLKNFRL